MLEDLLHNPGWLDVVVDDEHRADEDQPFEEGWPLNREARYQAAAQRASRGEDVEALLGQLPHARKDEIYDLPDLVHPGPPVGYVGQQAVRPPVARHVWQNHDGALPGQTDHRLDVQVSVSAVAVEEHQDVRRRALRRRYHLAEGLAPIPQRVELAVDVDGLVRQRGDRPCADAGAHGMDGAALRPCLDVRDAALQPPSERNSNGQQRREEGCDAVGDHGAEASLRI
mmetsp:Transcript_17654/g.46593  ORF Transcript_17654/g.46593 Transcript_17654/m.46593 type:complete len:227 (-) Transcript_17654:20-700(-)